MSRMTRLTRAVPVVAMLAVGAATPLVVPIGPALAGPGSPSAPWGTGTGISVVIPPLADTSWTYGNSFNYFVSDLRLTGGHQTVATSSTPQVCKVATDAQGAPTGALQLTDVGTCTVAFHIDGDATHAPMDSVVTHDVAPRALSLSCRDAQRASDEPNPDLTPVISNLAAWDAPSDFTVRPGPIPTNLAPGRWPVSLLTDSTLNPLTGAPRYVINSAPCTLTVNPVLKVTGMPVRTAADLVVDGKPVPGNRLVFPYGSTVTYSVTPVLEGSAPTIPPLVLERLPEAWFASASTGTSTGDTTVGFLTFGELVSASPFLDTFKQLFMTNTFNQSGWQAVRGALKSGVNAESDASRLPRLQSTVKDLQGLIRSTAYIGYLGRPDQPAVEASADQLNAYLQLILDNGGFDKN
jgi:hypothetical protein